MPVDSRSVFDLYDADGDGYVTATELGLVVRTLGYRPSNAELDALLLQPGAVKNPEKISFLDIQNVLPRLPQGGSAAELNDAFKVFDKDSNGLITINDLRTIFTTLGEPIDAKELDVLLGQLSVDDSGKVRYDTFIGLLTGGH